MTESRRPTCLTCVSFDVEAIVDGELTELELFSCFDCQDVLYFMADVRPRVRRLQSFELYAAPSAKEQLR